MSDRTETEWVAPTERKTLVSKNGDVYVAPLPVGGDFIGKDDAEVAQKFFVAATFVGTISEGKMDFRRGLNMDEESRRAILVDATVAAIAKPSS